jgi:hypothetical protein
MNWFLDSKLTFRLTTPVAEVAARQRALDFLKVEGYREIVEKGQSLTAQRGAWRDFLLGGDPRRIPHRVLIEGEKVTYQVTSRFLWFTAADRDVFRTEARMMAAFIEGTQPDGPTMAEVQKYRFKTDLRNMVVMLVLFGVAIAVMLAISNDFKRKFSPPPPSIDWLTNSHPHTKR